MTHKKMTAKTLKIILDHVCPKRYADEGDVSLSDLEYAVRLGSYLGFEIETIRDSINNPSNWTYPPLGNKPPVTVPPISEYRATLEILDDFMDSNSLLDFEADLEYFKSLCLI